VRTRDEYKNCQPTPCPFPPPPTLSIRPALPPNLPPRPPHRLSSQRQIDSWRLLGFLQSKCPGRWKLEPKLLTKVFDQDFGRYEVHSIRTRVSVKIPYGLSKCEYTTYWLTLWETYVRELFYLSILKTLNDSIYAVLKITHFAGFWIGENFHIEANK